MTVDERTRELVYRALQPVIGDEAAGVVSRGLMGPEVATRSDLDDRFAQVDDRFAQVDRRFEQVDRRFEQVDHRFELMEAQIRELRLELLAAFRGELVAAVSGQARMMLVGMIGTAVTIALAVVAVAPLL